MLERSIYAKLKSWKADPAKKALCVIGARQIGKTTVIEAVMSRDVLCQNLFIPR